ncbi:helix-turn-helix domain-containing protein [Aquimarina brevivitae]|uniref:Helix-turn-helix protein n=1 Tax=Aquimarina brevivitae TaxID=323412 RepID=A0A4Q7PG35_9FLAO|nr:helix-turn-helix transcriptional regulator [Aquimarina brevivitae]RZS99451.1 helix-turn-helix protein [Aquimarina brevivitae]
MDINNQTLDWNSPDILMQIATHLESPIKSIVEASHKILRQRRAEDINVEQTTDNTTEILISNTKELSDLIKEVVQAAQSKSVKIAEKNIPVIFKICKKNDFIQSQCKKNGIDPSKISKPDQLWLFNFEQIVLDQIKKGQLSLSDLSYDLAISERQLHRKCKTLLGLTPNKYIRILRLHWAKEFIDQYSYDTISEIAYAVGYFDTHYFSKLFYKQYGTVPKKMLAAKA